MIWLPLHRRRFGDHLDRMARALLETNRTSRAFCVVVAIAFSRPQLDDRVLRAGSVTIVALETIAAAQAALRLAPRFRLGQPRQHLGKSFDAVRHRQLALRR